MTTTTLPEYTAEEKAAKVEINRKAEAVLLRTLAKMAKDPRIDPRWLDIAKEHFEQGYMAMNRSILKPDPVKAGWGTVL